jgi:hypothetical protein
MKRFFLCESEHGSQRDVAEGIYFTDGTVVLRWLGETPSTALHEGMALVVAIHVKEHRKRFIRIIDVEEPVRSMDRSERWWSAFSRGQHDATQDRCENVPFVSVGGLERRSNMEAPGYVEKGDQEAYLEGYRDRARFMFGDDWQTCGFGWEPVLEIGASGISVIVGSDGSP